MRADRVAHHVRAAAHRAGRRPALDRRVARCEIEQARLLVLKTAWLMDTVGNRGARIEISAIKVAAPEVATWVIDRAIQAHGGGRRLPGHPARRALRRRPDPAARRRPRRGPPHGDRPPRDASATARGGRGATGQAPRLARPLPARPPRASPAARLRAAAAPPRRGSGRRRSRARRRARGRRRGRYQCKTLL